MFKTYGDSYKQKQHIIQEEANKFNEDCELFDVSVDDIENDTMQSTWDLVAPPIAQDDVIMSSEGCSTLQQHSYEPGTHGITTGDSSGTKDLLSKLYKKEAKNNLCLYKTIVRRSNH